MFRIIGRDAEHVRPDARGAAPPRCTPTTASAWSASAGRRGDESASATSCGYRIVRPDGEVREVHSRVRAERGPDGIVTRLTGVLQDVTSSNRLAREMGRANEELRQVNQLNADVLGVVGHDAATAARPACSGHLEELPETWEETTDEERLDRVERAYGAAQRLSALIDDILAMASADSGAVAHPPAARSRCARSSATPWPALHGGATTSEVRADGDARARRRPVPPAPDASPTWSATPCRYGAAPVGRRP